MTSRLGINPTDMSRYKDIFSNATKAGGTNVVVAAIQETLNGKVPVKK